MIMISSFAISSLSSSFSCAFQKSIPTSPAFRFKLTNFGRKHAKKMDQNVLLRSSFFPITSIPFSPFPSRFSNSNSKSFFSTNASYSSSNQTIFYTCPKFSRFSEKRSDDAHWVLKKLRDSNTQIIPVFKEKIFMNNEEKKPIFLNYEDVKMLIKGEEKEYNDDDNNNNDNDDDINNISTKMNEKKDEKEKEKKDEKNYFYFLGICENEIAYFAFDISQYLDETKLDEKIQKFKNADLSDVRTLANDLNDWDAFILSYSRGLILWHNRNKFCSKCGSKMSLKNFGHVLKCSSNTCSSSIYPRIDPAIIVLVSFGSYLLLGRQSRWKPWRYSLLAGFVELSENFENAVIREVKEESNVDLSVDSIRYVASQPWPFPSSLMIGFFAEAIPSSLSPPSTPTPIPFLSTVESSYSFADFNSCEMNSFNEYCMLPSIVVDENELEDAKWVHRDLIHASISGKSNEILPRGTTLSIPGSNSLANFLIHRWIESNRVASNDWSIFYPIPTVDIDEGVFKYVLMRVFNDLGDSKLIVRGHKSAPFHANIFEHTQKITETLHLNLEVLGGGRIEHHVENKSLLVYGYSQAYGQANHEVTASLLHSFYPFHTLQTSNEGY